MFLLDTNVVSELRKVTSGKADARFSRWAQSVNTAELWISVITLQELEIGVLLVERRDQAQGAILRSWLNTKVVPAFENRILPIDANIARRSAALHVPDPRPIHDSLIAATALVHDLVVVTRNTQDFVACAVPLLNPWNFE